jgi:hypothetical protein
MPVPHLPKNSQDRLELDGVTWNMLLEGVKAVEVRRSKRWQPTSSVDSGNSGRRFPEILAGGRWVSEVTRAERKGRCVRVGLVILGCLVGW